MQLYLKQFTNHAAYEAAKSNLDTPNVSLCVSENEVHYNPLIPPETRLVITYNVTNASNPTKLYYYYGEEEGHWVGGTDLFDKIEIDNVEVNISSIDSDEGYYQLSNGEHTAKYTLKDPTTINDYAFFECNKITNITLPNSVTSIDSLAFAQCSSLTSVTIPNSVTTISGSAFAQCSSLTSVTIPNSVTTIAMWAFYSCSGLTSIDIPDSVTSIGEEAFRYCYELASIIVEATAPPTLEWAAFRNNASGRKIYVPAESVDIYKAASGWSDYAADIEAIPTT